MNDVDQNSHQEIVTLTAEIVGAYVGHHQVASSDLPDLIATVGKELSGLGKAQAEPEEEKPVPAVPIRRSVKEDEIVCLICGQGQKMMKRHLATRHELDPQAYRDLFRLKDDYPMVAPDYAAKRSELAKKIGLGRKATPEPAAKAPRRKKATARAKAAPRKRG